MNNDSIELANKLILFLQLAKTTMTDRDPVFQHSFDGLKFSERTLFMHYWFLRENPVYALLVALLVAVLVQAMIVALIAALVVSLFVSLVAALIEVLQ